MSVIAKSLLVLSLALYATALATPHFPRNSFEHHNLVARVVSSVPALDVVPEKPAVTATRRLRKRANGRCKASTSSPVASSTLVSSSAAASPSSVVNVAPSPSLATSSSEAVHTTSSTPKAPSPSETPVPTTTAAPKTTAKPTSQAPAPTSASSGNTPSFLIGTQTGQGTFYATGLGACGITNSDTDYIAAVSHLLFDTFPGYNGANPNDNPVCNKKVTASYQGKSVSITITDRCVGCAITDLDFSPSAFDQLADPSVGRISGMTWVWDD
ncbi:hypothetical protein NEOLEDRAFT_1126018 [Neolentinus lepideus HHB14362 ss-1]|uniref:RlpA-like protein double-psi beta-barrel domain-containing protein n=1 Tax=Neolentinus lepideus HHB14362 ss-1 TaxID=1314782 RepID=A0A165W058_9AGAM|nr:hypothetical protein NEOLEDRAFT_1126018 [Neolentinus lepideus HHB14362 ss-1]